jgi:hypothetical protein
MLIDRFMPDYDFSEHHSVYIDAPREVVFEQLEALTVRDVPSFSVLMGIRSLPARLTKSTELQTAPDKPLLEQMTNAGFKVLFRYPPTEGVLGVVGRFWKLRPEGMRDFGEPKDFYGFDEAGYTKAVMNFHIWPEGEGSTLSTETRVKATDSATKKKFGLYWRVIQPGSGLIRRGMLRAVKKRAEAAAAAA